MSAFICNDITVALVAMHAAGGRDASPDAIRTAGQILLAENYRSLEYDYHDVGDCPEFPLPDADTMRRLAMVDGPRARGAIRCYMYQCNATNDFEQMPAYRLAEVALSNATGAGADNGWELGADELPA